MREEREKKGKESKEELTRRKGKTKRKKGEPPPPILAMPLQHCNNNSMVQSTSTCTVKLGQSKF